MDLTFFRFFFRNCAFVNFTNIQNAIKAIDGIKNKPDYANLRIAHGKDRCANPPRSGPQGGGMRRTTSNNTAANVSPNPGLDGGVAVGNADLDLDIGEDVDDEAFTADAEAILAGGTDVDGL